MARSFYKWARPTSAGAPIPCSLKSRRKPSASPWTKSSSPRAIPISRPSTWGPTPVAPPSSPAAPSRRPPARSAPRSSNWPRRCWTRRSTNSTAPITKSSTCVCRKAVTMTDLAMQAMYKEKLQIMDGASHFNTDSPPPFCATFAEVEVDTETGQVRVVHLATAVDPGTAINPMQAEGQVEGAVAQGLGYALTEELVLDDAGRPVNANFLDYKMFAAEDMPKLTTILVETDEPLGPYGERKSTRLNSSHRCISYAVFCLKKK